MKSLEMVISYLEKIKSASGRNQKLDFLKQLHKEDLEGMFESILLWTYDFYRNYWVRCDPDHYKVYNSKEKASDEHWKQYIAILDKLRKREVTGNAARQLIIKLFEKVPKRTRYWFAQILNRELEVGLRTKSFEKFYPDLFPKVGFMLAEGWKGNDLKGRYALEPKIDGERAAILFDDNGNATVISRSGRPKSNCEHLIVELQRQFENTGGDDSLRSVMFDGELRGKTWGEVGASRGTKRSKKKLFFYVFDMLSLKEWKTRKTYTYYMDRRKNLEEFFEDFDSETNYVKLIPATELYKDPTAEFLLKKKKEYLKAGHEGFIAKRSMSLYLFKRDIDWLKCKFRETIDAKVIGATEGKKKYKGVAIGALIVEGKIGKVKFRAEVGQGLSDAKRKKFYVMWKENRLKGLVVEIDHYGMTADIRKDKGDKVSSLRNAIFKHERLDKTER